MDGLNLLEDTRKKVLANDVKPSLNQKPAPSDAQHNVWVRLGEHTSMCERRADEASRDVTLWLKCEYMKQFIGETMTGRVSSITQFGAFVTLNDVFVDGLLHISELGQDYFEYDEASYSLKGRVSGKTYRLGDEVQVRIAAVDSDTRKIENVLESQLSSGETKKSSHSGHRSSAQSGAQSAKKPQTSAKSAERKDAPQRNGDRKSKRS